MNMLDKTGFCYRCGRVITQMSLLKPDFNSDLFCSKKHEQQYYREQDSHIKKGKRAGYGLAGSTH